MFQKQYENLFSDNNKDIYFNLHKKGLQPRDSEMDLFFRKKWNKENVSYTKHRVSVPPQNILETKTQDFEK